MTFIGHLLCARYCVKCITYINSLVLPRAFRREVLLLSTFQRRGNRGASRQVASPVSDCPGLAEWPVPASWQEGKRRPMGLAWTEKSRADGCCSVAVIRTYSAVKL